MILIRHGQSHFNLHFGATRIDPGIGDDPHPAVQSDGLNRRRWAGINRLAPNVGRYGNTVARRAIQRRCTRRTVVVTRHRLSDQVERHVD